MKNFIRGFLSFFIGCFMFLSFLMLSINSLLINDIHYKRAFLNSSQIDGYFEKLTDTIDGFAHDKQIDSNVLRDTVSADSVIQFFTQWIQWWQKSMYTEQWIDMPVFKSDALSQAITGLDNIDTRKKQSVLIEVQMLLTSYIIPFHQTAFLTFMRSIPFSSVFSAISLASRVCYSVCGVLLICLFLFTRKNASLLLWYIGLIFTVFSSFLTLPVLLLKSLDVSDMYAIYSLSASYFFESLFNNLSTQISQLLLTGYTIALVFSLTYIGKWRALRKNTKYLDAAAHHD